MNVREARFHLDRAVLERDAAGQPVHVEQIDLVLCEDVYFIGAPDHDCLVFPFDLPCPAKLFDCRACAAALLRCDSETGH
jgi:hypothetical protein